MKLVHRALAALLVAALPALAAAQAYPSKPIRMIIPLAAASAVDNAARVVAQRMSENMGQQIVVENIAGASGLIGAERVAKAVPDGYTIGAFNDSILTMVPNMYERMPWDPVRDFAPVSLVGTIEWGLIAAPNAPFKSAGDLIAAAKANPGKINYASGGNGSPQHIAMALFASSAGIDLVHVPYKGATQAALDVAAGQVPVGFQGLGTVASLVRGNKLRLIGVSAQSRNAQFPDVPTINESGLPNFFFNSWFTVMAPAGTPPEIVTRLNLEIRKALESKDVQEKLVAQGFAVFGSSPEELSRAMVMQLEKYRVLMKAAGIKAD